MKKMMRSIMFITLFSSTFLQATFWEQVTGFGAWCGERSSDVYKGLKEGTKNAFKETGERLPFRTIELLGLWIMNKVIYKNEEVEAYYRNLVIARKKNFLESVENDLYKQKEELEGEWDQIQEDEKQLEQLKKQLAKKTVRPGIFVLIKAKIFRGKVTPKSTREVEDLAGNVKNLEDFLKKHKADHQKNRERLADLIDIYYDQYKQFLKEDPAKAA